MLCTRKLLSVFHSMRKLYMPKQPTYHHSKLDNGEGRTDLQKNSRRNEKSSLTVQTHKTAQYVWSGGTMREKLPGSSTECILMGQSSSVSTMLHRSLGYLVSNFVPSLQFSEMDLMQVWSFVQATTPLCVKARLKSIVIKSNWAEFQRLFSIFSSLCTVIFLKV